MASFESFLQVAGRQYRVYHSDVELHQYTDILGRPASPTFGGTYVLEIEPPPQGDATLYGWMVHPALFLNGQVLIKDLSTDTAFKVIKFFNAYCVGLEGLFDGTGSNGQSRSYRTRLTISPQAVEIGGHFHDNNWPAPEPIVNWDWTAMDAICNPKPKRGLRQPTVLLPPTRTPPLKRPPHITLPPIAPLVTGALVFIAGVLFPHPAGVANEWAVQLPEEEESRYNELMAKRAKLKALGEELSDSEFKELMELCEKKFPNKQHSPIRYNPADYHGKTDSGRKSKAPDDPEKSLQDSILLKAKRNGSRRIAVQGPDEFVIFDEESNGVFHGHVRKWDELSN